MSTRREGLDKIFSEVNMLEYAGACINLAAALPEHTNPREGFDTLIIPSRGAVPFFLGMLAGLRKFNWSPEHDYFYKNLGVQSLLEPLLPKDSGLETRLNDKKIRTLLMPFTADLNIPKFDNTQDSDEYTKKTRQYWANVVASFFQPSRKRRKDPYFRTFTEVILEDIENRKDVAQNYRDFPSANRFSMIDTVISGRASNHILKAFDNLCQVYRSDHIVPRTFLIVDENGEKLRTNYKVYLNTKKALGQVMTFEIPRIVSEDEGASLEGVAAVVYPNIMKASKQFKIEDKEFFVGAGSWFIAPNSYYLTNFQRFMDLVYSAIDAKYSQEYESPSNPDKLSTFRQIRQEFVDFADKRRCLEKHTSEVSSLYLNSDYKIKDFYETSSHVGHVIFSDTATRVITNKIYSFL